MIKHTQTVMGSPHGDCFSTCLACILEMPAKAVPNFVGEYGATWLENLLNWLAPMNLGAVFVQPTSLEYWPGGFSILSVDVVDGFSRHCVVAWEGDVVWDPSPVQRAIIGKRAWTSITVLDPAKPIDKSVYAQ